MFRVYVYVNGFYRARTAPELISVVRPSDNGVTGGGYLVNEATAGTLAGDVGLKTNMGFNVKTRKNGRAFGRVVVLVRRVEDDGIEHVYQIRSNSINSFVTNEADGTAIFNARVTIQDVTDPLNVLDVDGNASMQIALCDRGEPGDQDSIGITVWNKKGGLYLSSFWDGVETLEDLLDGGNLQVR